MATLHALLTHNTTTNVNIGNTVTDEGLIIDYSCVREYYFNADELKF
jgi:hypothetical protein